MFSLFVDALNDFEKNVYHNKAFINNIMTEIVLTRGIYLEETLRANYIEIAYAILNELGKADDWKNIANNELYVKKRICTYCKEFKCYSLCNSCNLPYCGRNCQRRDWPTHKFICKRQ